jgi:hypothetical protein
MLRYGKCKRTADTFHRENKPLAKANVEGDKEALQEHIPVTRQIGSRNQTEDDKCPWPGTATKASLGTGPFFASFLMEGLISPMVIGGHGRCILFENDHLG